MDKKDYNNNLKYLDTEYNDFIFKNNIDCLSFDHPFHFIVDDNLQKRRNNRIVRPTWQTGTYCVW